MPQVQQGSSCTRRAPAARAVWLPSQPLHVPKLAAQVLAKQTARRSLPSLLLSNNQIKLLRVAGGGSEGDVASFLARALEPPGRDAVTAAVRALVGIGALQLGSEELTPLGVHLATLPVVGSSMGVGVGAGAGVGFHGVWGAQSVFGGASGTAAHCACSVMALWDMGSGAGACK